MTYYAHIAEDGRRQTVQEHLENTGTLCAAFAKAFGAEEQGRFLGLAHDIGKYSDDFQKRLNGGHIVDHATAGAYECARQNALWAACCVAGHHGGLPDVGNMRCDTSDDPTLTGRIKRAADKKIPHYELQGTFPQSTVPQGFGKDPLADSFTIRMLYSCLVDADYLDTERFMSSGAVERDSGEPLSTLLDRVNQYVTPWWTPSNELNQKRCDVLRACIQGAGGEKGIYTLTVPTGGGKTVASIAFALNHAVKHKMDRVIYVIPYTSIIEQTAEVFRRIFGESNVIEHHSNASYEVDENSGTNRYKQIRATENWDAPIVVTTAVQFFESLYANRPAKCRKLHNIANSVIVFDEAQMLPSEHLRPCVAAVATLVEQFYATAVLCTATQPVLNDLFEQYAPNHSITELCSNTESLFSQFRRVTFENMGTTDVSGLAERMSTLCQVLCIVNSRKAAQDTFLRLPQSGSFHLSTLMYPAHRRETLKVIRDRLEAGLPCRVVSTSLIEAGVDVDFPSVYREMAGLDSVLQAAGRCNREGKRVPENSVVTVFSGVSKTPLLLRTNIGAAKEALGTGANPSDPETIERYFKALRSLCGEEIDKTQTVRAFEKGIAGNAFPFRTVAEHFRLIDGNTKTIYIPLGDGAVLMQRLRNGERTRDLFRRLGQYGVNVFEWQYQALLDSGAITEIDEGSAELLDMSLYHEQTGLSLKTENDRFLMI